MSCLVCGCESEKHHIKTRGAGGDDSEYNLMDLCRIHHTEVHSLGLTTFANKYEQVNKWLLKYNWEFNEFLNKWRRAEKEI